MAQKTLEKLADKIIRLTPEEGQQLALIIRAKIMPEQARQQGLLQQQQPIFGTEMIRKWNRNHS